MLGLCGYLKILDFSVKYRSTLLVNSFSPIHDIESQIATQEQGSSHLSFENRSFLMCAKFDIKLQLRCFFTKFNI